MKIKNLFFVNVGLIMLLLGACGALKPTPSPTQVPTQVPPTTGVQYHFVTNKLTLPITKEETQAFALNVDGDPQQHPDNMFGEMLTLLASLTPGIELQTALDEVINTGQLISLHVVKADDPLNDPSVSWSIFLGQKTTAAPIFDGTDKFTLDAAAPTNLPIIGSISNAHFTGGPGAAHIKINLLGQSVEVNLVGVLLEADISANGCINGKLGGGVTADEFKEKLLPALADGLNQIIKTNTAASNPLLQALDSNKDGAITAKELEDNPFLMIAISPDLDLLDASGKFYPNQDGVKDSYSVGLGFTCVAANFTAPGDLLVP
jgi:hypothetical protein